MTREISKSDVEQALSEIDVLVSRIDDTNQRAVSATDDNGTPVLGREVAHGGHTYHVVGKPGTPFLRMEMGFDAAEALAFDRVQADGGAASGAVGQQTQQIPPTAIEQAAKDLHGEVSEDEVEEIRSDLFNRLSVGSVGTSVNSPMDTPFVTGFDVVSKLFVYDENITPGDFNKEVQHLVNAYWGGRELLVERYGLRDFDASDGSSNPSMFH